MSTEDHQQDQHQEQQQTATQADLQAATQGESQNATQGESQNATQGESQNATQGESQNATQGEWQYAPMYYWQHNQWKFHPYYYDTFINLHHTINQLRQNVDKKWSQEQENDYFLFLQDLQIYIKNYIWTGAVMDYNQFTNAMMVYGLNQNPVGFQLFHRQMDYLNKKSFGFDFKGDKKKKKKESKQETQPKTVIEKEIKPKEIEIIRKEDPAITAAELLLQKEYPSDTYIDGEIFKKPNANLIFIGHVDSGKSTLTGNIMKELKQVDEQELARNKQEAKENNMATWELAFIADVDPNERKKGKTVECSKMMFTLENRRFTLFDAPGHKNYVPNMIMGACQADIAVLIISAKEGEFESGFEKEGQTKQHAMLATALGVHSMIAVVTKMTTVQFSQKRFNHIKEQVSPFLSQSCGFKNVQFIPIDSLNNLNIHSRQEDGWYQGPCLIEVLNNVQIPQRDPDGPLRIPVVDRYREVGKLFLYGKVESGKIAFQNQIVSLLPNREYLTIKEIYNARDERLPYALAGENVKLTVKGVDVNQVNRGDIICSNMNYCQESQEFKANLTVLELPEHKKLISSGYECVIHMHAISEEAEIALVDGRIDPKTQKVAKASFLRAGEVGRVVIKLQNSACMQKFEFMPGLGRFTIRDEGKTIGFGEIIKIKPSKSLTQEQKEHLGLKVEDADKSTQKAGKAGSVETTSN